ncbi:hypothetical protein, partial [Caldithrix abyssi]
KITFRALRFVFGCGLAALEYFLWKIYPAWPGFENFCAVLKLIRLPLLFKKEKGGLLRFA